MDDKRNGTFPRERLPGHCSFRIELSRDGTCGEPGVGGLGLDSGDPLHDVEVAEARFEAEVRATFEILGACRVERELVRAKVPESDVSPCLPPVARFAAA